MPRMTYKPEEIVAKLRQVVAPAVVRHLADPDRTDRLGHALALRGYGPPTCVLTQVNGVPVSRAR
jgi:hypothetical protein